MNKVLILSALFPPDQRVGGKRMYQLSNYLPASGWSPLVVASPSPHELFSDPTQNPEAIDVRRIYAPACWSGSRLLNPRGKVAVARHSFRSKIKSIFKIPLGKELLLAPWLIPRLLRILRYEKIKVIYATCGPPASLFHAYLTSRISGIPLVLDLRDPWTLNFLQRTKPPWVRWMEKVMERVFIRHAAAITFTSITTCQAYQQHYKSALARKMTTVYTGYDSSSLKLREPVFSNAFTIAHFGNCFGYRTFKPVLQAIKELAREKLLSKFDIVLKSHGSLQAADIAYASENDLDWVLKCDNILQYTEGLSSLLDADLLLLLGYGSEKGFIPAKTFDYMLLEKPILCITECAELASIVKSSHAGYIAAQSDIAMIKAILMSCLRSKADRRNRVPIPFRPPDEYDVHNSARKLAGIFDDIAANSI
jgi:hypothetical protein